MAYSTDDPRVVRAAELAREGRSREEIAAEFGVSVTTASRLAHAGGAKIRIPGGKKTGKKPRYFSRVLELHEQDKTITEIADTIQNVHPSTVAQWLRDEGYVPRYDQQVRGASVETDPRQEEALRRYLSGESAPAVSKEMGLSERTVEWWAKRSGVWEQGGLFKRHRDAADEVVQRYRDGEKKITDLVKRTVLDYYQIRIALEESGDLPYPDSDKPKDRCPCGQLTGRPSKKYCSDEHRVLYGKKKQADPENWVTKTCRNCGEDFEIRKSSQSYGYYCSNACAQRHTKVKKHYAIKDLEIVLDSSYECLFWSLCMLHKIPIERYDREEGLEWKPGCWYAPDFLITDPYCPSKLAVELKGVEDDQDAERWQTWRAQSGPLAVLTGDDLRQHLIEGTFRVRLLDFLWNIATP